MRKFILFLLLLLLPCSYSFAVLQDEDLDKTVSMLYKDLKVTEDCLNQYTQSYEDRRQEYWAVLNRILAESKELSLVLYSQSENWIFGMAQAHHRVSKICEGFRSEAEPFQIWTDNLRGEISRYEHLRSSLVNISDIYLTQDGIMKKRASIKMCENIQANISSYYEILKQDEKLYDSMDAEMRKIETYNQNRFDQIKERIFFSNTESYTTTITFFGKRIQEFYDGLYERFFTGQTNSPEWNTQKRQLFGMGFLILLLAWGISYLVTHRWFPKKYKTLDFIEKRKFYMLAFTCLFFAVLMFAFKNFLIHRYYFIVSVNLFLEYVLLVFTVLLSITLRLDKQHIKKCIRLYMPTLVGGLVLLFYRISLVPNIMISFTLPIVLLLVCVFQLSINFRVKHVVHGLDLVYGWVSFALSLIGLVLSWIGYHFMAVQIMMFWTLCLTGFQAVSCFRYLFDLTKVANENKTFHIKIAWLKSLMNKMLVPLMYIFVFVGSVIWAAHVFNMAPWAIDQMTYYFVHFPDIVSVSFSAIVLAISVGFVFNYLIYAVKSILYAVYKEKAKSGVLQVCISMGNILAWGIYVIVVITAFHINNSALIAAVGGISMGIGFALKETIDNLFCGIALMMGRVRPGDLIECDGIRGRITNIGVRSTTLESLDGSIISFLNNQLFAKNFKNLTKNHNFEVAKLSVGIAYGDDIDKAKEIILSSIEDVEGLAPEKTPSVYLDQFGGSSVDFAIIVWVPLDAKRKVLSEILEKIYKAFDREGITIPFPQQDVYLHTTNASN